MKAEIGGPSTELSRKHERRVRSAEQHLSRFRSAGLLVGKWPGKRAGGEAGARRGLAAMSTSGSWLNGNWSPLCRMVQPRSASACVNAEMRGFSAGSFSSPYMSTPIRRTRSPCCALAASGHAAAPPSPAMNSRRRRQILIGPSRASENLLRQNSTAQGRGQRRRNARFALSRSVWAGTSPAGCARRGTPASWHGGTSRKWWGCGRQAAKRPRRRACRESAASPKVGFPIQKQPYTMDGRSVS
jgi:hypothetical protein